MRPAAGCRPRHISGFSRHRAAEDAPGYVGEHIVESRFALVGDVFEHSHERAIAPDSDRAATHKQQ